AINSWGRGGLWAVGLRLTAWYVAASFVVLLAAIVVLYVILASGIVREQDAFLATKISVLRGLLRDRPANLGDLEEEVEQTWAPRQYARTYARVVGEGGKVIVESPQMGSELTATAFPPAAPISI